MFWECHVVESTIEKLLDQPRDQVELQNFLDENDLIQECLNQNQRLIDYLVQPETMKQLIRNVITVPADGEYHNAHVVSELLSGDFQQIQGALLNNDNLELLNSFLSENRPDLSISLNPILASYFARIVGTLIMRKTAEILNYFKSCPTFKNDFIKNLDATSIVELLFRFVADSGDQRSSVIQWYQEIGLIDDLMEEFRRTDSILIQMNLSNLFIEFLRLAFDHQTGSENEFSATGLTATIERLLYGKVDIQQELSRFVSSANEDRNAAKSDSNENKLSPMVLAETILSRSNFEEMFDALAQRKSFLTHGCDCLDSFLDILNRHLPSPVCLPLNLLSVESNNENSSGAERMEVNDEATNKAKLLALENLGKDPIVRIYVNLLESVSTRLPQLIELLSSTSVSSESQSFSTHRQFIEQPLGVSRLNLIKVLSKLIQIIANDFTGDEVFKLLDSTRLFDFLLDLFDRHIYNNFLHTQVIKLLRVIVQINSVAVKQSNDIWSRTPIDNFSGKTCLDSSTFHYKNRQSFKLFQSILDPSSVNLFERLIQQYERLVAERKSSKENGSRFETPNSGHIAQILRILRDNSTTFDDFNSVLTSEQIKTRWQNVLDELAEEEKKWSAMHVQDRYNSETSRTNALGSNSTMNDSNEAQQRRQTFHTRSFGSSALPRVDDDDDDDEGETLNIDDDLMNSEQNNSERKVGEMKKISFDPQFPPVFDEQNLWFQTKDSTKSESKNEHDDSNKDFAALPDLFEAHRKQQEKMSSSTESTFEQLCSLRSGENHSGSILYPLQSSSTIRDEAIKADDKFWQDQGIFHKKAGDTNSAAGGNFADQHRFSDDNDDSDDENSFLSSIRKTSSANNMMDVFRNSPSTKLESIDKNDGQDPDDVDVSSLITEMIQNDENEQENQLEDNFSYLLARNLMKPSDF